MPLVDASSYRPPFGLAGGHVQTLLPHFLRRLPAVPYRRERIETPDGDFLDLDWAEAGHGRLAAVSYGMEGSPHRDYTLGMVRALQAGGWDVLVWNYRGCGGEPNRKIHFYHGGLIEDLETTVRHAIAVARPREVALVGFSLGGNLTLSYLGRRAGALPAEVRVAVAISAPVDVSDCADRLREPGNRLYTRRFIRLFRERVRAKMPRFPGALSDAAFAHIRTLEDYDAAYTAPHFGFASVADLYRFVSPRPHLPRIRVPTLLLSARNDPFLGPPAMAAIWTDENKFSVWLKIEVLACEAMHRAGPGAGRRPAPHPAARPLRGEAHRRDRARGQPRRHRLPDQRGRICRPVRPLHPQGHDQLRRD
jgi:predicted alpha/beta-fold hydrolase